MLRILAIPGSLRQTSTNKTLLKAVAALAHQDVEVVLYEDIGLLPHFNPDLEVPEPQAVTHFKAQLKRADGLLICSPEYAHGVPGTLKNALDWLVGGVEGEIVGKPTALLKACPESTYAQESLAETLRTMCARLVPEASVAVNLRGKRVTEEDILKDPEMAGVLTQALEVFTKVIRG